MRGRRGPHLSYAEKADTLDAIGKEAFLGINLLEAYAIFSRIKVVERGSGPLLILLFVIVLEDIGHLSQALEMFLELTFGLAGERHIVFIFDKLNGAAIEFAFFARGGCVGMVDVGGFGQHSFRRGGHCRDD